MATANIPEVVQPGNLFTPDDELFSIDTAGLPNGEDGLELLGASGKPVASQAAISGVHYPANASSPFSINFWLDMNMSSNGTPNPNGNISLDNIIMGVLDVSVSATVLGQSDSTTGRGWLISVGESNRSLTYQRSKGASASAMVAGRAAISDGWHMITIRDPGGASAPSLWQDLTDVASTSNVGTAGTPGTLTAPHFFIGAYPVSENADTPDRTIRVAKVALFDRLLTDQEVIDLYAKMVGP